MPSQVFRRALVVIGAAALVLAFAGVASAAKYVVLYKAQGVPADGGAVIRSAGGTVVASYAQIGVIIADSSSSNFRARLMRDSRIQGVSSTAGFASQFPDVESATSGSFSDDLAHPTQDVISPDTGPGETRAIHNNCVVIPTEVAGVIGVTATGVPASRSRTTPTTASASPRSLLRAAIPSCSTTLKR
jgi:hypothetical protein